MEEYDKAKGRTINWGRLRLVEILSIPLSSEIRMLSSPWYGEGNSLRRVL